MPKLKIGLIVFTKAAASAAYYGGYALDCQAYSSIYIGVGYRYSLFSKQFSATIIAESLYSRVYSFQDQDDC